MEKVSIVIPAYNHERYVVECLESTLATTYRRIELIFIDDGSSDKTFTIASKWLGSNEARYERIVCKTQENMGLINTLNLAISLCEGDYIALLASDDALTQNGIADRVEYLKQHPTLLAVFGRAIHIDEDSKEISINEEDHPSAHNLLNASKIALELIAKWYVPGPTLLVRRRIYSDHELGQYDSDLLFEDRDFYLRMLANNTLGFVNKNVAKYRVIGTSFSRDKEKAAALLYHRYRSEWKNIYLFGGKARWLLLIVALHSYLSFLRVKNPIIWILPQKVLQVLIRFSNSFQAVK